MERLTVEVFPIAYWFLFNTPRDEQYDSIFDEALTLTLYGEVQVHKVETVFTRSTSNRKTPVEEKQIIRETLFSPIVKSLLSNVKTRSEIYCSLAEKFAFLP